VTTELESLISRRVQGSLSAVRSIAEAPGETVRALAAVCSALDAGGTVLTCGNGGSAAEALHLAEELLGRYRADRAPYPAVCMNADPTALTCIANDFGFDAVFARQIEALAKPNDALVVLSTSGKSKNILAALSAARDAGLTTIGLLGHDGGPARALCAIAVVIPSDDTAHIQEAHQVLVHLILEAIESGPR